MNEATEKEVRFIIKRADEQLIYIESINKSSLNADRKNQIITSARGVLNNFQKRMDEIIKTGLCDAFDVEKIAEECRTEIILGIITEIVKK